MGLMFILALAQAATATPPQPVSIAPAKPKMICTQDVEIGSRLRGKRLCYTQQEWEEYQYQLKSGLNQKQHTGYFGENPRAGCPAQATNCR